MATDFAHLHVHTEYSLLDGMPSVEALAHRIAELGQRHLAITDHGVMSAMVQQAEAAQKMGLHPVYGVEAYITDADHKARAGETYHLLLLAKNLEGYRNLVALTTRAHLDGFWRKPRIDHTLLETHRSGVIATSSCLGGEIPQAIMNGDVKKAEERIAWYRERFGDDFFLELQQHDNTPELYVVNDHLVRLGKAMGVRMVATNDAHFLRPRDLENHTQILAMSYGQTVDALCMGGKGFDPTYAVLSGDEMWMRFRHYGADVLENTLRIAEQCTVNLDFGRVSLPELPIPHGYTAESYLAHVAFEGLQRRFPTGYPHEYETRLRYELEVINATGFPAYILIVWDYVKYARSRNIPCLPRGSVGASLVMYCLGITDVDPIRYNLVFERFLSHERLEMPDIDMDMADNRRQEVLDYIVKTYGERNTAQIITFVEGGARTTIRDMARIMNTDRSVVQMVLRHFSNLPASITIQQALASSPDLATLFRHNPEVQHLLRHASTMEGRIRGVGKHACGVVVSREPLHTMVPLQRATRQDGGIVAALGANDLAKMGLLKMDILGLAVLSIIDNTLQVLGQLGIPLTLDDIPAHDPKTLQALGEGHTLGVFQLESDGMTRALRELKPSKVEDLFAMIALYRPGPLDQIPIYIRNRHNPDATMYVHPMLEPILAETYGVIVYQEQVMQILQTLAGFTLGRAYVVIKAIAKKNDALMQSEAQHFKDGCLANGLSLAQANQIWSLILPFAGYSFNRPHATLYGLLSWQTAYLKTHYPAPYFAALLSAHHDDPVKVEQYVLDAKRLGVTILPPDIHASDVHWTVETETTIRVGLGSIRNIGESSVAVIVGARKTRRFANMLDLVLQCDTYRWGHHVEGNSITKLGLEALVKSGTLDSFHESRSYLLAQIELVTKVVVAYRKAHQSLAQDSLFGDDPDVQIPQAPIPKGVFKDDKQRRVMDEKAVLGFFVSAHPLSAISPAMLFSYGCTPISALREHRTVNVLGIVTAVKELRTKKDARQMAVLTIEGHNETTLSVVVFPEAYERYHAHLRIDMILILTGSVSLRNGERQMVVHQVQPFVNADALHELPRPHAPLDGDPPATAGRPAAGGNGSGIPATRVSSLRRASLLVIVIPVSDNEDDDMVLIKRIADVLKQSCGGVQMPVRIVIPTVHGVVRLMTAPFRVNDTLVETLRGLVGQANIELVRD